MTTTKAPERRTMTHVEMPRFVFDPSFEAADAADLYAAADVQDGAAFAEQYMPDDVTRDHARRMHYAAYRLRNSHGMIETTRCRKSYYDLRDRIVLGNRKLVYKAVRRRMSMSNRADDYIGDCHIVLIQAVAAYNPWMGIRFSTYAYTCLIRALSRIAQRAGRDWLSGSISLDVLSDGEPSGVYEPELVSSSLFRIEEYLREDHPLLTAREKTILALRFSFTETVAGQTLEKVGQEMGLSKERVRQVQASALDKLRRVLVGETPNGE